MADPQHATDAVSPAAPSPGPATSPGPTGPASGRPPRHALVVADGDVPARAALDAAWPGWEAGVVDVIAADGGLARARALDLRADLLVGDLDSLSPELAAAAEAEGMTILRARSDKDESDAELALLEAVRRGATRVTVLGAFGGPRLDHALANLWLLAHPGLAGIAVVLLDARSRASLVAAPGPDGSPVLRPLPGPVGATVSLLPLGGDVTGITTTGFRFPLRDEPLRTGPARGLSNVRTAADASVAVRNGRLLVVETAVTAGGLDSPA
jgi:thiamine pyrophosphokinase